MLTASEFWILAAGVAVNNFSLLKLFRYDTVARGVLVVALQKATAAVKNMPMVFILDHFCRLPALIIFH